MQRAGLYIRFRSDAPAIHARWTNRNNHMPHMTDVGVGGLDLYAYLNGKWRFVGSGFNWKSKNPHERCPVGNMLPVMREYMLYLPLYDALDKLEIGVPDGYAILEPELPSPRNQSPHRHVRDQHSAGRLRVPSRHGAHSHPVPRTRPRGH